MQSSTSGSSKITSKLEKSKIIKIDRRSRINGVKVAKYSKSYVEYCPDCESYVETFVEHQMGACAIITLLISLLLIIPIFFFCCCICIRDSYHHCPECRKLLAVRKMI
ncbi:unnamed protein product [Caenorhabditis angaria]|uniref:LITAF domain-containing protein n=1 Tax=Caenorhabditis angaria TaxID=860376 RepID=A0A9P1IIF2_9PELO|nr:unnamed protein product [Caenorhabditis angaria]